MSLKTLYLTSVITVPNEAGQARIDKALNREKGDDSGGLPLSWYQDQGLRPPKDIDRSEEAIDEDGMIFLQPDELEYEFSDLVLPLKQFDCCEEHEELGSYLFTRGGKRFHIEESPEQIFQYIHVISRNWWEKLVDNIKLEINKLKWNKKN